MNFEQLIRQPQHLLLKALSGSQAYNLQLPTSDTDIKGIYVLPQRELYGLNYAEQVSDRGQNEVYFEIGRFIELLTKNNPNILELLSSPQHAVQYRHALMDLVRPEDFLSKLCFDSFAGYAKTQIKKARGLNKKINRPMEAERKTVLDFCYVVRGHGSLPLSDWLREQALAQEACGLVSIPHFRDSYALFTDAQMTGGEKLAGIASGPAANDVQLSTVPKGLEPAAIMHFNKDGYSVYCKDYHDYWEWVGKRNDARYQNTLTHGKNYDAKNMMHTFRLLSMAEEIARYKKVIVHRDDREELLKIRAGVYEYEALMKQVEEKMHRIEEAYRTADLPNAPDSEKAEQVLIQIREKFYEQN